MEKFTEINEKNAVCEYLLTSKKGYLSLLKGNLETLLNGKLTNLYLMEMQKQTNF